MEMWPRDIRALKRGRSVVERLPGRGNYYARLLDRYLGIALVFGLGTLRRRRKLPVEPKRIGLLNSAAVGDTILMSGPVADLRAQHTHARITLLSGPSNYDIARMVNHVDDVIRLPVFNPLASLRLLRAQGFDVLLDFGPWCRLNAVLATLSGARFVVGFRTPGEARHFGYDLAVEHSDNVHELENHRRIVRALGIHAYHPPCLRHVRVSDGDRERIQDPYVVCHLWPGGSAARQKEWPTPRWVALSEYLARKGYGVVFTGSRNQHSLNEAVIAGIRPQLRRLARNIAGAPLIDTLRAVAGAQLTVSVDTGVVHMAAALDVPLVALYGPSKAERWGPVGERPIVVESPLASAGYLNLGFETLRRPPPCMEAICYESVQNACTLALQRARSDASGSARAFLA
ncbi:MAG TPA: glycosyltransferase family 9 protein [Candidatus Binataceae bacterium]|nr:glycosyltransferase family 9 protein [Candidatus Binataceae bacterium]